jgi:hypothetical protein
MSISEQNADRLRVPGMTPYIMVLAGLLRRDRSRSDRLWPADELRALWDGPLHELMGELDDLVEAYIDRRPDRLSGLLALGLHPQQADHLAVLFFRGCAAAVAEMRMMPGLPDR